MARIFNSIRQRLLKENRLTRYLIYAIGEILLVVIGILIALQLNTWKAERADAEQVSFYLIDLHEDLIQDEAALNMMTAANSERSASVDRIFEHIAAGSGPEKLAELIELHMPLYRESYFVPNQRTIDQIRSTGHGGLIKNTVLRNKLFAYYAYCERMERNNEVSTQLYQHHTVSPGLGRVFITREMLHAAKNIDLDIPHTDMAAAGRDQVYLMALLTKGEMSESQNRVYETLLAQIHELLRLMDEELPRPDHSAPIH